jgi:MscS family membrane protein
LNILVSTWRTIGVSLVLLLLFFPAVAQQIDTDATAIESVRTDSPRQTLSAFESLRTDFERAFGDYRAERDGRHAAKILLLSEQIISLFDLSDVPPASRRKIGGETAAYLLDIFGRIAPLDLAAAPRIGENTSQDLDTYSIPNTPFRIARVQTGNRTGEFLFSADTISLAPRFYGWIEDLPLRSALPIKSWTLEVRQVTGPMIPAAFISAIPSSLQTMLLGEPMWKIIAVAAISVLALLLLIGLYRIVNRFSGSLGFLRIVAPIGIVLAAVLLNSFFAFQINISGEFSKFVDIVRVSVVYFALTWAFWILVTSSAEALLRGNRFSNAGIDASMTRLLARILGVIGGILILSNGAQELGLPVFSILAGLGIGGLAVALAIRPTFENLISGFILYLDRPIRVGDFCTFGDQSGTVETIGVRSTQVRAPDRTRISIPNSQFADMQIINWAQCDQMMIKHIIGLRYETDADQLRYVLAKIREMMQGHPRIDSDTVRVRFVGFGSSSLDIEIRIYARTREWNDFYAIREDLFLRIKEIVEKSGTGFAFPSQTVYLGRDEGVDEELGDDARKTVAQWRKNRKLPFPQFDSATSENLNDKLDYPPRGSPDYDLGTGEISEQNEELLSGSISPTEQDLDKEIPQ